MGKFIVKKEKNLSFLLEQSTIETNEETVHDVSCHREFWVVIVMNTKRLGAALQTFEALRLGSLSNHHW